ncbi:MAG: ribosome recycling factor [Deltaproteobacteria bacterium]|nr:MAG: ribosome recycling factor [Deltaproteobacteria bacterium]
MAKAIESLERNFGRVRTGRASLTLLDGIRVDYYGTPTPINQVAALSIPEPRLIVVQPWESNLVPAIERAILQSDMDLNPTSDGKLVRIPIPKLSEERRKDLVKVVRQMTEDAKVSIRNARRDANSALDKLQKDKEISEDDNRRMKDDVQETTDSFVKEADKVLAAKEAEVLEV